MKYELATNEQLETIFNHDKGCPPSLLEGVVTEMIKRDLLASFIMYAAKRAFKNANYVINHVLRLSHQEFIHIAHIEIFKESKKFKRGMRTPKTYFIMCLISEFSNMRRSVGQDIRKANYDSDRVDDLDVKIYEAIFKSHTNVERHVIAKMTIENIWGVLRPVEQEAIMLEQSGYSQYEIAERLGFHKTHGNVLLKRAYKKLKKAGA